MHWFGTRRGDWTDKDYFLTLALTIYEDGLCSCGQPMAIAHHPDNDGWYDARKVQCKSCAKRESANTGQQTPEPGEKIYTVYTRPADKPLPAR